MKALALVLLLVITGCAGSATDPAAANRNRLATVEASYGTAQVAALAYAKRPLCGQTTATICADPSTVRVMQAADRSALAAIQGAHEAVRNNPADPAVGDLIVAAASGVAALQKVTPK